MGSIFVLYTPLQPSIFSVGGIFLALGMIWLAKHYEEIMNVKSFFYITLFVEFCVLIFIISFLILNYSYKSALIVYVGYQLTFVFGSYLVRIETITLKKTQIISFTDIMKQKGYLVGLVFSYVFYKILEYFNIYDKQIQVYDLYIGLLILQILIINMAFKAFLK